MTMTRNHEAKTKNNNTKKKKTRTAAVISPVAHALVAGTIVQWAILWTVSTLLLDSSSSWSSLPMVRSTLADHSGTGRKDPTPNDKNHHANKQNYAHDSASVALKNDEDDNDDNDLPILMVSGSDGSGTRLVVDLLGRLGVPMILDNAATADVDASVLFNGQGWPPLVQAVLQTTHSANYEWNHADFNASQQAMVQQALHDLHASYHPRGYALRQQGLRQGMAVARKVAYGFKAPITLVLWPLFAQFYGSNKKKKNQIRVLHVVRDGRDVALSSNQSPVQKFYNSMYGRHENTTTTTTAPLPWTEQDQSLAAMHLWNDWNVQAYQWAQQQQQLNDDDSVSYLVLRTEDLLHPTTRLASLHRLADFVGSPRQPPEVCCLSQHGVLHDMGKSAPGPAMTSTTTTTTSSRTNKNGKEWQALPAAHQLRLHPTARREEDVPYKSQPQQPQRGRRRLNEAPWPALDHRHHDYNHKRFHHNPHPVHPSFPFQPGVNVPPWNQDMVHHKKAFHPSLGTGQANWVPITEHVKWDTMVEKLTRTRMKHAPIPLQSCSKNSKNHNKNKNQQSRRAEAALNQRYGKWKHRLEGHPEWSRQLHTAGATGLALFGYEPYVQDWSITNHGNMVPDTTMDECSL